MKIQFQSGQEGVVDLNTALLMASGEFEQKPYRAAIHVQVVDDDNGNVKPGSEAWIIPRQIRYGADHLSPAEVQISGLTSHSVEKGTERLACYAMAISIAGFVNRAAEEGLTIEAAYTADLAWDAVQAMQDAVDEVDYFLCEGKP